MVNYQNGLIYKLVSNDIRIKESYYGSTTNFVERRKAHKICCNDVNNKKYNQPKYKFIRDNGGWDNWSMILIKYFPCDNKRELERAERYEMEKDNNRLNIVLPGRSQKEWREDHKEELKEKIKEWRKENIEQIKEKKKIYREKNKEYITEDQKKRYINNKDQYREKNKEWRENNKEYKSKMDKIYKEKNKERIAEREKGKVTCDCGSIVQKGGLARHKRSQKHVKFIEEF